MQLTNSKILVTGGASGIGRGLAEAFHKLGNRVVIAGRREAALREASAANPGMAWLALDVDDPAAIRAFAARVAAEHPDLDTLVNNAGIMRAEDLTGDLAAALADAEAIVTTNLLGPLRLTSALLPLLRTRPRAAVVNVTSGLAYLPLATTPTYSATKAGLASWTDSLRYQLQETTVAVQELVPPYVQTDLMGGAEDPRAMPLADFIAEVVAILQADPQARQICVERVGNLRFAERNGAYEQVFKGLNDAFAAAPH